MADRLVAIPEPWEAERNDALDVFEVRTDNGRLVAMIPIGETAAEVEAQHQVRHLIVAAPRLLGAARAVLLSPKSNRLRDELTDAVAAAGGGR